MPLSHQHKVVPNAVPGHKQSIYKIQQHMRNAHMDEHVFGVLDFVGRISGRDMSLCLSELKHRA